MSSLSNLPIGVFDSGVGGLTVLKALQQQLPYESFIYIGDTARLPYGTKSRETIERYAVQVATKLIQVGIKLLVIACNTATSLALEKLQTTFPSLPILGVIEPGAKLASLTSKNQHIAVIATESTLRSYGYQQAIHRYLPKAIVTTTSCGLFVPLAEEGWINDPLTIAIAKRYLEPLLNPSTGTAPDCLILGCTHYPVLIPAIEKAVDHHLQIINSADSTATSVKEVLAKHELFNQATTPHDDKFSTAHHVTHQKALENSQFWVTDSPERFSHFAQLFLGHTLQPSQIELIDLYTQSL